MAKDRPDDEQAVTRRSFLQVGAASAVVLPLGLTACACEQSPQAVPDTGPADTAVADTAPDTGPTAPDHGASIGFEPDKIPQNDTIFSLGVQAGAMTESSALLWSYTDDDHPKWLRVWIATDVPETVLLVHEGRVTPKSGYFREPVTGLRGGTWYSYAFFEGTASGGFTARSVIGRFRAALPAGALEPITLAATHGTHHRYEPWEALVVTAEHDYDLFCQLGDMTYNDGAETLPEYRAKWQQALKTTGYRALLPRAGSYYVWDDHEFINDSKLYGLPPAQLEAGLDAFFEAVPAERLPGDQLWTSYRWGKTAEFFLLDCRLERQPDTRKSDDPIYISKKQIAWLKQALQQSPCHFKVLLNSVPITKMPPIWLKQSDRWQGYAKQREELLDHLTQNKISNVWFLTGDFHAGMVSRVESKGPRSQYWEIMAGPGGNGPQPLWLMVQLNPGSINEVAPSNQFDHFSGDFAATLITFDPQKDAVRIRFIDAKNKKTIYDQWLSQSG